MASIINQEIPEFSADAYVNGEFKTVTSEDVKGNWAIFLFYPADFTFVCPTELEDMAGHYEELKGLGVEYIQYQLTRISRTKHGMILQMLSAKYNTQ